MIHLAGPAITCGTHRRQRCSWCGTIIEDIDLANVGIPICGKSYYSKAEAFMKHIGAGGLPEECERSMGHGGECGQRQEGDFTCPEWAFEALIDIDGTFPRVMSTVEPEIHEDGTVKIPEGSCMSLPVELTGRSAGEGEGGE